VKSTPYPLGISPVFRTAKNPQPPQGGTLDVVPITYVPARTGNVDALPIPAQRRFSFNVNVSPLDLRTVNIRHYIISRLELKP
jgi:hypothetical protein